MASDQMSGRSVHQKAPESYEVKHGRVVYVDFKNQVVWIDMEFNTKMLDIKFEQILRIDPRSLREGEFLEVLMVRNNVLNIERAELTPLKATFIAWINQNRFKIQLDENRNEIEVPIEYIKNNLSISKSSRFILWKAKENFKFAELILETSPQPDLGSQGPNQSAAYRDPHNHLYSYMIPANPPSTPGYHHPSYSPVPNYQPQLDSPYYQSFEHKEYLQWKLNEKISTCGKERLPLDVLRDSYSDSKIRQRLEKLKEEFDSFRKSRGDGNCYYRAVGVAYLEHLCRCVNFASYLTDFINNLYNNQGCFSMKRLNLETRDYLVKNLLYHHKCGANDMLKLEELLQNPRFDMAIIAEMRCITANYLEINKDSDDIAPFLFDGIENKVREILTFGNEAEGIEFSCLARGLGVFIKHVSMVDDHSYDVYGPENVDSAPLLHVLYKGGHYDMIYTKNMTAIDGYDLFNLRYGQPEECSQEMVDSLFHIKNRPEQVEEAKEERQAKSLETSINMSYSYNSEPQHSALQYSPQVINSHYQYHHESSLVGSNMQYISGQASSPVQYPYHQDSSVAIQYPSSMVTPYDQQGYNQHEISNSSMQTDTYGLHQSIQESTLHNRTLNPTNYMDASSWNIPVQDPTHNQRITNPYDDTPGQSESYSRIQENPLSRNIDYPILGGFTDNKDTSLGQPYSHYPVQAVISDPELLSLKSPQKVVNSIDIRNIDYPTPGFPDNKDYSSGQSSSIPFYSHNSIQSYSGEAKYPYLSPQAGISDPGSLSLKASQNAGDSIIISCGCKISLKDLNNQLFKLVCSLPNKDLISKYLCRSCYEAIDIRGNTFIREQIQQLQSSENSTDQKSASLKQKIPCICCELEDIPLNRHRDFPSICLRCVYLLIRFQLINLNPQNYEFIIKNSFSTCSVCKGIYKLGDVVDHEKLQFMKMKPRCGGCKNICKCDTCAKLFDCTEIAINSKHFKCNQCVEESRRW